MCIGFLGTIINQFLKITCRIPRPWVKDKSFTIVESAKAGATGYSFPSGHTQSSVGIFGGIALWNKNKAVKIISVLICVMVPLSRMYLGVHTPLDVGVSVMLSLALLFGLYPIIRKTTAEVKTMRIVFIIMTLFASAYLCFVSFYNFPANVDAENLAHGAETAYKMFGVILGLWLSFEIDTKYISFKTEAKWWVQILKLLVGLIPILIIKSVINNNILTL